MSKTCKGCIYESGMRQLVANGYIFWSSTQPHPCVGCKRFPTKKEEMPDNYEARKFKLVEVK
jgi:hypothetical protein